MASNLDTREWVGECVNGVNLKSQHRPKQQERFLWCHAIVQLHRCTETLTRPSSTGEWILVLEQ